MKIERDTIFIRVCGGNPNIREFVALNCATATKTTRRRRSQVSSTQDSAPTTRSSRLPSCLSIPLTKLNMWNRSRMLSSRGRQKVE